MNIYEPPQYGQQQCIPGLKYDSVLQPTQHQLTYAKANSAKHT